MVPQAMVPSSQWIWVDIPIFLRLWLLTNDLSGEERLRHTAISKNAYPVAFILV